MNYGDRNFIEITQQTKFRVTLILLSASSQSSESCRASRAVLFDNVDTAKLHGLDTSNVSSRVVSSRAKWNMGHNVNSRLAQLVTGNRIHPV